MNFENANLEFLKYTSRRVVLDTIGTRMTRIERMSADFF
jgi:hypothetical protein